MRRFIYGSIFAALILQSRFAWADANSIGPNGINSSDLTIELGLTGDGIDIGQVELRRPGDPGVGKDEAATMVNSTVDPEQVFFRQGGGNFAPNYNLTNEVDNHAIAMAGVIISTDGLAQGVAQEADLFSVGFGTTPTALEPLYEQIATSINHIATLSGQDSSGENIDIRAINMSFNIIADPGIADGTSTLSSYIDWSARVHDILYVSSGSQLGRTTGVPDDNFNGITVQYSSKVGSKYRQISVGNVFTADDTAENGERTFPDIMAPGQDVLLAFGNDTFTSTEVGTSIAAPHLTGTAALLHQHAKTQIQDVGFPRWSDNAQRHQVMKAVIMNSADKIEEGSITTHNGLAIPVGGLLGMERTALDINGDDWFASEADDDANSGNIPLDDEMGVGHLNASGAFQQFRTGEFNDSNSVDVPVIGWDYGFTSDEDDINRYRFNEPLKGGSFISLTLAWDRVVTFEDDANSNGRYDAGDTFVDYKDTDVGVDLPGDSQINDLDIYFQERGAPSIFSALASSSSREGNIEHLFFQVPSDGDYEFWVVQHDADIDGIQNYGVAWWGQSSVQVFEGDFNGDGMVDGADLAQWRGDFGADPDSDADGDGDSDGADFLAWQRNLGLSAATSTAGAVPEPAAWVLGAVCLTFFAWRRDVFSANCPRRQLLSAAVLICNPAADGLAADSVTVPLADILTTSSQEGMQQVKDVFRRSDIKENKVTNRYFERIHEGFGRSGASNAFLVDATNLHDAVRASASVYAGLREADTPAPVNQSNPVRGSHWLVAFLGPAYSSPVRWMVESATVTESKVRLTYHSPETGVASSDFHPYYYWVPLGKLAPGTYQVELFDADAKAVTLMRRVKVEAKPK